MIIILFSLLNSLEVTLATDGAVLKDVAKAADHALNEVSTVGNIENTCISDSCAKDISPELILKREISPFMKKCFESLKDYKAPVTFEESIRFSIELNFGPQKNMLPAHILSTYDVGHQKDTDNFTGAKWAEEVGLFTHPMCEDLDYYFISRNNKDKKARIENSQADMKKFVKKYNSLFTEYKKAIALKKSDAEMSALKQKMKEFYFALMASIALNESLGDANNSQQKRLAESFSEKYDLGDDYKRPLGVKFYYDRYQSNEVSRQNVGLYQFTPKVNGNIDPCYHAWNNIMGKKSSACKIDLKGSDRISFEFVAASDQIFNAFCGTNKLVQSFGIQVNARNFKKPGASVMQLTHSDNLSKNVLKESKNRCISPFAFTNNAYMHFGVLGFTTSHIVDGKIGSNTQKVLTSVLKALQ